MNDLIERLRSIRGNFIIPVESPPLFAWAEEAADALESKDADIEQLTAELRLYRTGEAYLLAAAEIERLQRAYRPPDLVEYNALQARVEALETALREIALDSDNPTNQRTWAAERADKALAATEREGE